MLSKMCLSSVLFKICWLYIFPPLFCLYLSRIMFFVVRDTNLWRYLIMFVDKYFQYTISLTTFFITLDLLEKKCSRVPLKISGIFCYGPFFKMAAATILNFWFFTKSHWSTLFLMFLGPENPFMSIFIWFKVILTLK